MATTIADIARESGVSVATVSRVVNNKPDVKPETAAKVKMAIERLNYSPNAVARGLVHKSSRVIGLMVSDIASPSFPELARGIISTAKAAGYSVMLFDTNHDAIVSETLRLLQSKQVDGALLSFDSTNRDELIRLRQTPFPIVQIYRKSPEVTGPTVAIDNVGSAYQATKYLVDLGHRVIGHITTGNSTQSGSERLKGYREALEEAHIPYREELVQTGDHSYDAGAMCMDTLLDGKERPTAVFATHDLMAIGAYESVSRHGLSIPGDISIVGHDNIEMSHMILPKLTTIDTFKFRLGQEAVDLLLKEIGDQADEAKEKIFATELIVRDSARRLP